MFSSIEAGESTVALKFGQLLKLRGVDYNCNFQLKKKRSVDYT